MKGKLINITFSTTLPFLFLATVSWSAAYDWGTEGVSNTAKVSNVSQITTNQYNDSVGGDSYPQYTDTAPKAWDSKGKWIVYTANIGSTSDSDKEICKIRPDGTGFSRLTDNTVEDSNASFAKDGRVYFQRYFGSTFSNFKIMRMLSDGTGVENLTNAHSGNTGEMNATPSPDASKIAFRTSTSKLWVADSDGKNPIQVSEDSPSQVNVYNGEISWSPDSEWIAYRGYQNSMYKILTVRPDGTNHGAITTPPASSNDNWPAWSPDGSRIAFQRYEAGQYKLMLVDPDGSNMATLDQANTGADNWTQLQGPLSWSPDSKWLAYRKYYSDGVSTYYDAIFIINITNQNTYQLTTSYTDSFPIWSPTGTQLLFHDSAYNPSRDDSAALGVTNNATDLLLLNLMGNYGSSVPFPWPMVLPAIENNGNK